MSVRKDVELAALVQADQLRKGEARVEVLRGQLGDVRRVRSAAREELDAIETSAAALRAQLGLDDPPLDDSHALDRFEPSPEELAAIDASLPTFSSLQTVALGEGEFRRALLRYAQDETVDLDADPIAALLPASRIAAIGETWAKDTARLTWDRWDYGIVGGAALIGAVLDVALVSVPPDSLWKGVRYAGSPLTRAMQEKSAALIDGNGWLSRLHRATEEWAKVPFDVSRNNPAEGIRIDGLRPAMHRIMSPGHDPVLGLLFGILDLVRGTCTLIDRAGVTHVLVRGPDAGVHVVIALVKLVAHLLSDLPTTMGLPPPFFTALQWVTAKTPFAVGASGEPSSVNDLTRWMYGQGYDSRHFATMSVVPLVMEAVVRVGFFARHHECLVAPGEAPANLTLKRDEMLLAAHAMAACTNGLKVALMQGNPLALNQAVWMAAAASTLRWLKSHSEHDASVQRELIAGWRQLRHP